MPAENMVHMFGGTKKKSSLIDESMIYFPREDESSPRIKILQQFCEPQLNSFRECMTQHEFNENLCLTSKRIMDICASKAFQEVNKDP